MESPATHRHFLGRWVLIPESCQYEQGDPPTNGRYHIEQRDDGSLQFTAEWIDAVSDRELNSRAYYRGKVRMVAQRQLDDTRSAMRVTQVVYLPDGSRPANVSVYRRA